MLASENQPRGKRDIDVTASVEPPFSDPFAAQSRQLAISRHFSRITTGAVNPGITDLLRDYRKSRAHRPQRGGHSAQVSSDDTGSGELTAEGGIVRLHFFIGVRATVIGSNSD